MFTNTHPAALVGPACSWPLQGCCWVPDSHTAQQLLLRAVRALPVLHARAVALLLRQHTVDD